MTINKYYFEMYIDFLELKALELKENLEISYSCDFILQMRKLRPES